MSVRYHFPKSRLAQLLRAPGGLRVADAMAGAKANLEDVRQTCLDELDQAVSRIELAFATYAKLGDMASLNTLYGVANEAIGSGSLPEFEPVDIALNSLCELLDALRESGARDMESVEVHVRALRLLIQLSLAGAQEGAEAILDGLRKVGDRYALASASSKT